MSDIQEPLPWGKSSATVAVLEQLVADRLLPRNLDSGASAWISPHPDETEPKPLQGYVVSFVCLHERGFGVPVSRFMRALCEPYGATSALTPSRRRRSSSPSARVTWGSRRTRTCGGTCSGVASTRIPFHRG